MISKLYYSIIFEEVKSFIIQCVDSFFYLLSNTILQLCLASNDCLQDQYGRTHNKKYLYYSETKVVNKSDEFGHTYITLYTRFI